MSSEKPSNLSTEEQQFWDAVDMFIDTANTAAEKCDPGVISSAVVYAAARYCAFNVASFSESRKDFISDTEDSVNHLVQEFRKLLEENMADYGENYKIYMKDEEEPK
ncbi:DUF3144 domain-containing protein [Teredinibacter haidensis]|uniref:DUF3144 domain-containing protein n=1 Tax=Teredinibacter haidensis TaxID=2731755 RepID=UPI0009489C30|nr:DUF3144 domain-containing protein [Teredinibacter haidensis]